MNVCDARIADGTGRLVCVRDHDDAGHVFHGDTAPDKHDKSEPYDQDRSGR